MNLEHLKDVAIIHAPKTIRLPGGANAIVVFHVVGLLSAAITLIVFGLGSINIALGHDYLLHKWMLPLSLIFIITTSAATVYYWKFKTPHVRGGVNLSGPRDKRIVLIGSANVLEPVTTSGVPPTDYSVAWALHQSNKAANIIGWTFVFVGIALSWHFAFVFAHKSPRFIWTGALCVLATTQIAFVFVSWLFPIYFRISAGQLEVLEYSPFSQHAKCATQIDLTAAKITADMFSGVLDIVQDDQKLRLPLFLVPRARELVRSMILNSVTDERKAEERQDSHLISSNTIADNEKVT